MRWFASKIFLTTEIFIFSSSGRNRGIIYKETLTNLGGGNSKSEARNSKQGRMLKIRMTQT
jgi:hypothetical protein